MNFFRLNRANRNLFFFSVFLFFFAANLSAKIVFSSLNLNEQDEVLFTLTHKLPGSIEYSTILKTKIKDGQAEYFPRALTCFPERMHSFDDGKKLFVRNRYGSAVYDFDSKLLKWVEHANSFPEKFTAPFPFALSSTGKWYCSFETGDSFKGALVVTEVETGRKIVLDDDCAFSYSTTPVKWSPNGENFVYEKNGSLYLCNPEKLFKGYLINEEFLKICDESINSVEWSDDNFIIYISSDLIFKIEAREVFSLGLYSKFVPLGRVLGRMPQKFDSRYDKFWMSDDSNDFCVIHHSEIISWYKLNFSIEDDIFVKTVFSMPFSERDMTPLGFEAFWTARGNIAVCVKLVRAGTGIENYGVYTINASGKMNRQLLVENTHANVSISPDKTHLAFLTEDAVFVCHVPSWKPVCRLRSEQVYSLAWCDGVNLCVGGINSVKKLSISDYSTESLFVSSAESSWWVQDKVVALKDSADNIYTLSGDNTAWKKIPQDKSTIVVQNNRYRVFCGTTKNSLYENAIYVRTLTGKTTTHALVAKTAVQTPPRNKVALVFDADENADGLNLVLAVCNDYNLKCTFFFNGEFIRRYPVETRKIAKTGHECAAIFYNNINLLDKAVYKDNRYIAKGLARLEDEFLACTGKELSLYWHAPYNKADKKVRAEGSAAGYTYVDVNLPYIIQAAVKNERSLSSAALYEKIDLFINELLATGCEFVTVSDLNN